ncbi:MAG: hypothetical protein RLZZ618_1851 [Pseudomonadota bacterium]
MTKSAASRPAHASIWLFADAFIAAVVTRRFDAMRELWPELRETSFNGSTHFHAGGAVLLGDHVRVTPDLRVNQSGAFLGGGFTLSGAPVLLQSLRAHWPAVEPIGPPPPGFRPELEPWRLSLPSGRHVSIEVAMGTPRYVASLYCWMGE